jgi:hypothetical protein
MRYTGYWYPNEEASPTNQYADPAPAIKKIQLVVLNIMTRYS